MVATNLDARLWFQTFDIFTCLLGSLHNLVGLPFAVTVTHLAVQDLALWRPGDVAICAQNDHQWVVPKSNKLLRLTPQAKDQMSLFLYINSAR